MSFPLPSKPWAKASDSNLLQGYDFACLNKQYGVVLQIGGSDQWGNITSGIDLTRRLHQNQVFGLTVPLITKADGTKFGKTEGGAVWLDPKKTSPYKFYQFWINTADADVYRFLKFFTFMSIEEINALEEEDKNSGKAPRAQYVLAEQVTRLVHGEDGLQAAKRITECLFSGSLSALSEADFEQLAQDGVPMVEMEKGADLMQALVDSELQPSRGQARKTIASNANQLLKMAGKSMLEQIGEVERERLEYKEYIEQWIHEIKTPITAMKLLCENHRMDWTKELLLELEKTNRFTEQALYYARSEHTEKDYSVREMALSQVVHQAIADNKYLLLQSGMRLEVEEMQDTVYSDEKWVRFILNQLIANAVKYRTEQPVLRISTHKRQDQVVLVVEDNGIGIAASDLPRIFEKGFTGQNGRMVQQSTGIGLYLCKRLCEKLGIGITAESSEHGTAISLSFHINCLIHEVQS